MADNSKGVLNPAAEVLKGQQERRKKDRSYNPGTVKTSKQEEVLTTRDLKPKTTVKKVRKNG